MSSDSDDRERAKAFGCVYWMLAPIVVGAVAAGYGPSLVGLVLVAGVVWIAGRWLMFTVRSR